MTLEPTFYGDTTRTTICAVGPRFFAAELSATCMVSTVSPTGNCSGCPTRRQYCRTPDSGGVGGGGELRKFGNPLPSLVQASVETVTLGKLNRDAKS